MAILKVNLNATGSDNGSSWDNAFTDLQSAINAAGAEDEIWVAKGTYKPGDNRTDSFELKDGVTVYGGFDGTEDSVEQRFIENNLTILSGDIGTLNDDSDNSYTVVNVDAPNVTAILDGFTIEDGNSNKDTDITDESLNKDDIENNGGGVYNIGNLTLINIVVRDNKASADGGGIRNEGTLTLENVEVRDNEAADDGGGIRNNGTLTITDSTVADNTSVGTSDTSGGGGLINTGESANITNSTFSGNKANNGGAIRNDTILTLINSTLSGNTASESGGGLVNTINPKNLSNPAQVTITNSTITDNTAENTSGNDETSQLGAGIANFGNATVSNSTIAGNAGNDDFVDVLPIANTVSNGSNIIGNGDGTSGFSDGTNNDTVGTKDQPIDPLSIEDNETPPPIEDNETPPPIEDNETPPPIEDNETPPPIEDTITPPPIEDTITPPPIEDTITPPPIDDPLTPPPIDDPLTPPPIEDTITPPPIDDPLTPPPIDDPLTPPPIDDPLTPPPIEDTITPPPIDDPLTPPPIEDTITPPPIDDPLTPPPIEDTITPPPIEEMVKPPSSTGKVVLDEKFDNDSQFTKSAEFFSDGNNDYFGISDGNGGGDYDTETNNPPNVKLYTGLTGSFLTGQDLNADQRSETVTLTWSGLDITGLTDLQYRGDFAEFVDDSGNIDTTDFIKVYYSIDGGPKQNLLWFSGEGSNTVFRQDADFDGVADSTGRALGDAAQTFTAAIADTGSTLDLELEVGVGAANEDFAADNFLITGEPIATPGATVTQSNDTTNVTEGGASDSYDVVLDSKPTAEVKVNISTGNETTTDVNALTFTTDNWDIAQTVNVTAVDDSEVEGDDTDTITHAVRSNDTDYENFIVSPITVNIIDNDVEENNSTPDQEPDSPPISNPSNDVEDNNSTPDQEPDSPPISNPSNDVEDNNSTPDQEPDSPPISTPSNDIEDNNSTLDQEPDSTPTSTPSNDTANLTNSIRTVNENGNQMEVIDLTALAGQTVTATYEISRDADFDNNIYFYTVDGDDGNIDGVTPDESGYLEQALSNIVSDGLTAADGTQGETGSLNFTGGNILGIAIVANGTLEQAISNIDSVEGVYLSYMGMGASTDNGSFDHIRFNSTTSTFEFEDLANGGDQDFDDITIKMNF